MAYKQRLEETERRKRRLARRFRDASAPSERFAISREMARLIEQRRALRRGNEHVAPAG